MKREYQDNFSAAHENEMYDLGKREKKARTMVAVLEDFFPGGISSLSILSIGTSTGIIAHYLSQCVGRTVGIDIDRAAIAFAKETFRKDNLEFHVGDAMDLAFPDATFDAVICAQVYEHVPDARRLMSEIYRVLKPGGVCYFAAGNRLGIIEPHYKLPFLSVMPRMLAHVYIRLARKGKFYYEKHLSYWGLRNLVGDFEINDYTRRIVECPGLFCAEYMLPSGSWKARIARLTVKYAYWLCPGYIWLLRKT